MKDEALDFLPMIIMLGVVIAISFNLMIPMYQNSRELVYDQTYNKGVTKANIEKHKYNNMVNPDMDLSGLALQIASQTYFMPEPRVITIGEDKFVIQEKAMGVIGTDKTPGVNPSVGTGADKLIPGNLETLKEVNKACERMKPKMETALRRYNLNKDDISVNNLRYSLRYVYNAEKVQGKYVDAGYYAVHILAANIYGDKKWIEFTPGNDLKVPKSPDGNKENPEYKFFVVPRE